MKVNWDDEVPEDIERKWVELTEDLTKINDLQLGRHIMWKKTTEVQLHGFADASEKAYGCVIYVRSVNSDGVVKVEILCAKSRVAPLKSLTLLRLELCSALLLAELMNRVMKEIDVKITCILLEQF